MRCAAPKSPKGLLAGTQSRCGPQSPQGLLSVKHTMCGAGKYEWPVLEQIRTPFCSQNSNWSPNANLQPIAAQTPICSPNANSLPNAIPHAFQLPKCIYHRGAAPQTMQGLLSGKHAIRGPVKSEGPVGREAYDVRP